MKVTTGAAKRQKHDKPNKGNVFCMHRQKLSPNYFCLVLHKRCLLPVSWLVAWVCAMRCVVIAAYYVSVESSCRRVCVPVSTLTVCGGCHHNKAVEGQKPRSRSDSAPLFRKTGRVMLLCSESGTGRSCKVLEPLRWLRCLSQCNIHKRDWFCRQWSGREADSNRCATRCLDDLVQVNPPTVCLGSSMRTHFEMSLWFQCFTLVFSVTHDTALYFATIMGL